MAGQKSLIARPLAPIGKSALMGKQVREQLFEHAAKCLTAVAKTRRSYSGITPNLSMTLSESKAVDSDTTALSEMPTEVCSDSDGFSSGDSSTEMSEDSRHSQVSPRHDDEAPLRRQTSGHTDSVGTLAKLPRTTFDTTPGSKFASVPEVRCPPVVLNVIAPGVAARCQGTYELSLNIEPNGQPLWKHSSDDFWLFSTPSGRWAIGGKDVMADGFARSSGWIWQERVHHGQLPERVSGAWRQWNGTDFEPNPDIVVVVPWRIAKTAKKQL